MNMLTTTRFHDYLMHTDLQRHGDTGQMLLRVQSHSTFLPFLPLIYIFIFIFYFFFLFHTIFPRFNAVLEYCHSYSQSNRAPSRRELCTEKVVMLVPYSGAERRRETPRQCAPDTTGERKIKCKKNKNGGKEEGRERERKRKKKKLKESSRQQSGRKSHAQGEKSRGKMKFVI